MQAQALRQAAPRAPERGWLQKTLRTLVACQVRWSYSLDKLLPGSFQSDGNRDFLDRVTPAYLTPGALVFDIGGGKNPVVDRRTKAGLGVRIVGVDIDQRELSMAPAGMYDRTICADVSTFRGDGQADLVLCQALLEHVPDTDRALAAISSCLRQGGRALIFVPSRNAAYARLNLLLPERWKRAILFRLFPEMQRDHGFRAYYHRCTPGAMERTARRNGLVCEQRLLYFRSDYFRFCLPLHALWRAWMLLFRALAGTAAAETFTLVLRKETSGPDPL